MIQIRDNKRFTVLYLFFVLAVTFTVFSESVTFDFTNWDDETHLTLNPVVRNLTWINVKRIFSSTLQGTYIPLSTLSFTIEHHFFGLQPFVYHFNNIILHLLTTAGIYFFALRLGAPVGAAAIAAFIFGIHPIHVESVVWITERKDVLYAAFYMAAVLLYLGYQNCHRRFLLYLSVSAGIFSMLAKPMALSLPLILLICDWFLGRRINRQVLIEKIPYFIFIIPLTWITYSEQMRFPAASAGQSLLIWIWTFTFYINKFFMPAKLIPIYPLPLPVTIWNPVYAGAVLLLIVLIGIFWKYRHNRWLMLAGLFYAGSIFFLMRFDANRDTHIVADRFMYLPSVGICLFLGVCAQRIWTGIRNKPLSRQALAAVLFLAPALGLPWLTMQQSRIWRNSFSLWRHVIQKNPQEEIAYHNLAIEYSRHFHYNEAIQLYEKALAIDPLYAETYNNLGNLYYNRGNRVRAFRCFEQAIRIYPDYAEAYGNRGNLFAQYGYISNALHDMNMAVVLKPNHPGPYFERGNLFTKIRKYDLAVMDYTRAIELDPQYAAAYNNRGVAYYRMKMRDLAQTDFLTAARLNPNDTSAFFNQGLVK